MRRNTGIVMAVALGLLLGACQERNDSVEVQLEMVGYAMTERDAHRAAEMGDLEVMERLLENGVDLFGQVEGETALHAAARKGRVAVIEFLLDRKMSVEVLNAKGRTPLLVAAAENEAEAVQLLVRRGAEVDARDHSGYRALTLAAESGHAEVIEVLAPMSRGYLDDALFLASLQGHAGTVETLINFGASVYARTEEDRTALMMAAREGHEEVVHVLLEHGANRYAVDFDGRTAGQIALSVGQLDLSRALLAIPGEDAFTLPVIPAGVETIEMNIAGKVLLEEADPAGVEERSEIRSAVTVDDEYVGQEPVISPVQSRSGAQLVTTHSNAGESSAEGPEQAPFVMENYREKTLPMRVEGVEGASVRVRYLFGENKQITVQKGEVIPLTGLKIIAVEEKKRQTKLSGNGLADVSVVVVEDPRTGQRRSLVSCLAASAHEPFAVVVSRDGTNQIARRGALLYSGGRDGRYRVLDVRPTQIVLENMTTHEVVTVERARH